MSVVAGGVVGALVTLLLTQGFQKVEAFTKGGITNIFGTDPNGKPFDVKIKNDALVGPQYDLVNLVTTDIKKSDTPAYEIENPNDGDKRIFTIAIIPTDAASKTNGILEIFLNGVRLFPITDPVAGMLTGVSSINIPIPSNFGLKIKPREKLEVFLWGSAGTINVTFAVFLGNIA